MATLTAPAVETTPSRPRLSGRRLVVAGVASLAALLVSRAVPLLGPLLLALVLGAVAANVPALARRVGVASPRTDTLLLRAGVVLLGLKVAVGDVLALGVGGLVVVLVTVVTTYAVTQVAGRALGVDRELTTLIAAGFSICGAAAVAAVESSVRARAQDVALAVALVTVFGSAMIALVPWGGHVLGLGDGRTAVWAGASIHEVAQVLAAASLVGAGGATVLATAMTVKLARVALLAPVQLVSSRVCRSGGARRGPLVPGFLLGFLAAAALRSSGVVPGAVLHVADAVTTLLLAAAMFGLGTGIVASRLWPVPARALLLATLATATAAGTSLALVLLLT